MSEIDLPDVNVWLALGCEDHQHHLRARQYWENEGSPRLAFCRMTMLGMLRMITNPKVMQGRPFTPAEAWKAYRDFSALPEVLFLSEPPDVELQFAALSDIATFPASLWTDAYLAALAQGKNCRLVSFDGDFHRFLDLNFLHLKPCSPKTEVD